MNDLKYIVKKARINKGLSQGQVAIKSGLDRTTICKIESGERRKPNPETIEKLGKALNLDPIELLKVCGYNENEIEHIIDFIYEKEPEIEALYEFSINITGRSIEYGNTNEELKKNIILKLSNLTDNFINNKNIPSDIKIDNNTTINYKIKSRG